VVALGKSSSFYSPIADVCDWQHRVAMRLCAAKNVTLRVIIALSRRVFVVSLSWLPRL
jgi:hypothetical protein